MCASCCIQQALGKLPAARQRPRAFPARTCQLTDAFGPTKIERRRQFDSPLVPATMCQQQVIMLRRTARGPADSDQQQSMRLCDGTKQGQELLQISQAVIERCTGHMAHQSYTANSTQLVPGVSLQGRSLAEVDKVFLVGERLSQNRQCS